MCCCAVEQVDFTPTVSLLLGIPIPSTSVGVAIPEMIAALGSRRPGAAEEAVHANLQQLRAFAESVLGAEAVAELLSGLYVAVHALRGGEVPSSLCLLCAADRKI